MTMYIPGVGVFRFASLQHGLIFHELMKLARAASFGARAA